MPTQQKSESYLSQAGWNMHGDEISLPGKRKYTYSGTITSAVAAGDYNASARDNASVEALAAAKKTLIYLPNGIVTVQLRWRFNGAADDQHVLRMYAAAGIDWYGLVDVLTIDQGTQEHTTGNAPTGIDFIDVVSASGYKWPTAGTAITTVNEIGGYVLNTHKYDRLWIIATTLDTANSGTTLWTDWKPV